MHQDNPSPVKRSLPDNADPAVDYTTAAARPGTLRGSASLDIQTRQAQRLVYGRQRTDEKEHIIGLVRFGLNMKRIWTAAGRDDPYADWTLLKVETALNQARETIGQIRQQTEALLANAATGVNIHIAHSLQPVRVPLQFANAYGYMGAYLIADFDQLVCTMLTARHVGLISREESARKLHQASRMVRHAFFLSAPWRFTLVTRDDLCANNPKAQKAREAMAPMGELPQEIFEGTLRAQIAPEIQSAGMVDSVADVVGDDGKDEDEVDNPSSAESR